MLSVVNFMHALPFETVEEVLQELVYVENLVSDDCDVQAVTEGHLP